MRILVAWLINALALFLLPYVFPWVTVDSMGAALIAALVLGLVNALIRPILFLLTLPVTILTLGLFILVINGLLFWWVGSVPGLPCVGILVGCVRRDRLQPDHVGDRRDRASFPAPGAAAMSDDATRRRPGEVPTTRRAYSLEFFPPRTPEGVEKLRAARRQLAQLEPAFCSVTFGGRLDARRHALFQTVLEIRAEGAPAAPHISCASARHGRA